MSLIIRSSHIHAAGCFTTEPIRKGERVVEYTGRHISSAEGDALYDGKEITYLFGLEDGKTVIDGFGMAMFANHSCDPNCETDEIGGRIWIIAARDIAPGEEITYDYNLYDGSGDMPCYCGARKCRGSLYSPEELRKQKKAKSRSARRRRTTAKKRLRRAA